jgi:hypothetical protein
MGLSTTELVQAKGKGDMQTYWLSMKSSQGASSKSGTTDSSADNDDKCG